MMKRNAKINRKTKETDIGVSIRIDGSGKSSICTTIPFFDHMLEQVARHGMFDIVVKAKGDTEVDLHHTVEDVGICLGEAIRKAVGDKRGIARYGSALIPMDEALAMVALDLCDRPHFSLSMPDIRKKRGGFDEEQLDNFMQSLANSARMNLHVRVLAGRNLHHVIEACFKALGRALDAATSLDPRRKREIPSTKNRL
jgi:imidazoleglycerol-phosphate dehydratase